MEPNEILLWSVWCVDRQRLNLSVGTCIVFREPWQLYSTARTTEGQPAPRIDRSVHRNARLPRIKISVGAPPSERSISIWSSSAHRSNCHKITFLSIMILHFFGYAYLNMHNVHNSIMKPIRTLYTLNYDLFSSRIKNLNLKLILKSFPTANRVVCKGSGAFLNPVFEILGTDRNWDARRINWSRYSSTVMCVLLAYLLNVGLFEELKNMV